jgi:AraC-like DNA-binding protein
MSHPAARRAALLLRDLDDAAGSMEALARSTSLSPRTALTSVRALLRYRPQFRNHHGVQRFIHAYGHGFDANMLRAALDVGFGSYVQFNRAFKQVVGYAPVLHLERVREGIVDPARTGG